MPDTSIKSAFIRQVKVVSTLCMLGAIALLCWQAIVPLPPSLQVVFGVVSFAATIHAIEGAIAAALIVRYRWQLKNNPSGRLKSETKSLLTEHLPENTSLAILKASLYTFFVGTVGLVEIIQGVRSSTPSTPSSPVEVS